MIFKQKKFGERFYFEFSQNSLKYTLRDLTGECSFSVPYLSIDIDNISELTINMPGKTKTLGLIPFWFFIMAIFFAIFVREGTGTFMISLALISFLGLVIANSLRLFRTNFKLIPMTPIPPGANSKLLKVVQNKDTDSIIFELTKRWKAAIKAQYGVVNTSGNPDQEMARLKWLRDRNVLSELEFQQQIHRLHAISETLSPATPYSFN